MSLSLASRVNKISQDLERMRTVTLQLFYQADATEEMRAMGKQYSAVISPHYLSLPSVVDTLKTDKLECIRKIWLDKVRHPDNGTPVPLIDKDETAEMKFMRLLEAATKPSPATLDETFIRAAKYPVPSQYAIALPLQPADLRLEIIDTLVPFTESCALLKRLEATLELPLRAVKVAHGRTHAPEELRRSIH